MKSLPLFRPTLALFATATALLSLGCSTNYELLVDSISRQPLPAGQSASYRIKNSNPAIAEESLRYQEAAEHIKTALSGRGWWEAPNTASAALIVELDYGIGPPHLVPREINVPIYGNVQDLKGQTVTIRPRREGLGDLDEGALGGDDDQVLGYTSRTVPTVVFEKHLLVTCSENKPALATEPSAALWRVSVSIEDPSKDLRDYLPILASAVMTKIGSATDGVTMETLKSSDASIAFIKQGLE